MTRLNPRISRLSRLRRARRAPAAARFTAWLVALAAVGPWAFPSARAADDAPPAPRAMADPLATARGHIARERWTEAIHALRRVNATDRADWNNLMGFAMRKQTPPDLDGAQRYYDTALRLDPSHRGALEYAGELALMKGDPATARSLLGRLEQACPSGCDERRALEQAIQRRAAAAPR